MSANIATEAQDVKHQIIRQGASDAQLAVNQATGLMDVKLSLACNAVNAAINMICTPEEARDLRIDQAALEGASAEIRRIVRQTFAKPMTVIEKVIGE